MWKNSELLSLLLVVVVLSSVVCSCAAVAGESVSVLCDSMESAIVRRLVATFILTIVLVI